MAASYRIFISFAIEDERLRDFLVGQARNERSPFSLVDMSVKKAWDSSWKKNCRTKIRGCDGVIGIITKNTSCADGQLWELKCAYEEEIPVFLIYGNNDDRPITFSPPVKGRQIFNWSWPNIKSFLDKL